MTRDDLGSRRCGLGGSTSIATSATERARQPGQTLPVAAHSDERPRDPQAVDQSRVMQTLRDHHAAPGAVTHKDMMPAHTPPHDFRLLTTELALRPGDSVLRLLA